MTSEILIGRTATGLAGAIPLSLANRHGLISGATGTGKTVTLQVLAEQFSMAGVPVFMADVKGDLSGLAQAGKPHPKITERVDHNKIQGFDFQKFPISFWDFFGESGLNARLTIERLGPDLLSRILDLNDTQSDIMHLLFKFSKDKNLPLLDLKDFKAMLHEIGDKRKELQLEYGNITTASLGAIVRRTIALEESGGDQFFQEPSLELKHLIQNDFSGLGVINVLDARKLMQDQRLYSCFLLWLLTELFNELEEVGDLDKPKLVFFFDEAHLLFDEAPKYLLKKIESVVRLVRSKGVGVYFVTQSPSDVHPDVLAQLGHKIQHGLRATSDKERKKIKSVADNYPSDNSMDIEKEILSLGIGESIVSTLNLKGVPEFAKKIVNSPPRSQMGPIDEDVRSKIIDASPLKAMYSQVMDRESAYEILKKKRDSQPVVEEKSTKSTSSRRQSPIQAFFKSFMRAIGSQLGRQIMKTIMKSIKR